MTLSLKHSTFLPALVSFLIFSISTSCKKQDISPSPLFNPEFKDLQLSSGFIQNEISINANDWSVEYVQDLNSGAKLLDKDGAPMELKDSGIVDLQAGWLKLEKHKDGNQLIISLKENFAPKPRKFAIGILAEGKKDIISFTQSRGEHYAIVEKQISEIAGSRKEYLSDEGCLDITLTNNSSVAKYMETTKIFKNVNYVSQFSSDDYGAFKWLDSGDTTLSMDVINKEEGTVWAGQVPYKEGYSEKPFIEAGNKQELEVPPFTSIKVRGEMTYLERKCNYTFTIKNLSSGSTFKVSGIWYQKLPLTPHTIIHN